MHKLYGVYICGDNPVGNFYKKKRNSGTNLWNKHLQGFAVKWVLFWYESTQKKKETFEKFLYHIENLLIWDPKKKKQTKRKMYYKTNPQKIKERRTILSYHLRNANSYIVQFPAGYFTFERCKWAKGFIKSCGKGHFVSDKKWLRINHKKQMRHTFSTWYYGTGLNGSMSTKIK